MIRIWTVGDGAVSAALRAMKHFRPWSAVGAAASAGALLALAALAPAQAAAGTATARAATGPAHVAAPGPRTLFTCPGRSICLFRNTNLTGQHRYWNTKISGGHWIDLHSRNIVPHRSVNNNSGSDVWLDYRNANREFCVKPGARGNFAGKYVHEEVYSGYMWIRYGVNNCNNPPPHGP